VKKRLFLLFIAGFLLLGGCGTAEPAEQAEQPPTNADLADIGREQTTFDIQTQREFDVSPGEHGYVGAALIEHMNDHLPNRLAFSDRELEAAEWIVDTLLAMGFSGDQVEVQTFHYETSTSSWWGGASWMIDWFEESGYYDEVEFTGYSQNVILTLPGRSEQTIIMGAHYDGMANEGVSDNASGTVLLLENAYRMRDVDHYYTLQYVFFGAEEVGLVGSFYFADNMTSEEADNLILMINADVIMDGPDLIYAIGYIEALPEWPMEILWGGEVDVSQNPLSENVKEIAGRLNAERATALISKPHALTLPSDQLAFLSFGVPVMVFYGTHPVTYPETFIGDVLHTPDDNLDFIMENHPGRVERALYEFGLFLETITMSENIQ